MERNRVLSGILLAVVLMILLTPYTQQDALVRANPIYPPPLAMPLEFINTTICFVDGGLLAKVNATYMFQNFFYDMARIDYPLPPNAQTISVTLDNRSLVRMGLGLTLGPPQTLEWTYNSKIYSTAIGDWPMINFTINHAAGGRFDPYEFGLVVYYEHFLPFAGGDFTYLYALGSSRYMDHYSAWGRSALVTVQILMNYTDLNAYTVGYSNESWVWTPATHTVTQEYSWAGWPATYTLVKEPKLDTMTCGGIFGSEMDFTEDFAVVFTRPLFDLTGDLKVDIRDLAIGARAFGSYPGHPNWKPVADINRDGTVDIRDLVLIAKNYGKTYS